MSRQHGRLRPDHSVMSVDPAGRGSGGQRPEGRRRAVRPVLLRTFNGIRMLISSLKQCSNLILLTLSGVHRKLACGMNIPI